jgi:hypothetical protein
MERPNQPLMSPVDQEVYLRNAARYECIRNGCFWPTFIVSYLTDCKLVRYIGD